MAVGGQRVQIWNVADQPVRESDWPHPQEVFGMRFNRAGTRLVTSCQDDLARVFAVDDTSLPAPLYAPVEHATNRGGFPATAVFCDEDRKLVTLTRILRQPVLRGAATGQPVTPGWTKLGHITNRCLAVSSDSHWLAVGGYRSGFLLKADGQPIELKHTNHVASVAFSPDGQSLLTTCFDGTARWWPLLNMAGPSPTVGSPITFPQRATGAQCVFSPDGSSLAISAEKQIVIWERPQSQWVVGQVAWAGSVWRPRPSLDGQFVTPGVWHACSYELKPRGGTLQVARMADGQPAGATINLNGLLWDSCLCADNRSVAAATVDGATGILTFYDIESGTPVMPSIALPDLPVELAARPKHHQVAVLCRNGKLFVIDYQQGQTLLDLSHGMSASDSSTRYMQVAYSPDGATLLTVTPDGVFVRDAQTGELRFPSLQPVLEGGPCRAIDVSPDSRLLATAVNGRNMVQVWDLTTGEKVGREMPHPGDGFGLYSVAFSPDGQRILTGHKDGHARLWDWRAGQLTGTPMRHPDEVYDAQFTSDGQHVVTAVRYSSPQVWNVATRKLAVPVPQIVPEGSSSNVLAIAGDRVVVTSGNRYSVLDLSLLRQKPTDELPTLLTRAELTTNQKLQLGELVPLEQEEWTSRWERWVAARQTPEEMARSLASNFDEARSESLRRAVAKRAIRLNLTKRLQQLRPNDPHLQIALAVEFFRAGRQPELQRILPKAMADAQEALQKTPTDDSLQRGLTNLAPVLADLLLTKAETATRWTILKPVKMKSEGGATLTIQSDGSILASGKNPDQDTYELTADVALKHIKAIRLEAIPDTSLPRNGPGRYPGNGNFHLNEFRVLINGTPRPPDRIVVWYGEGHWDYRKIIDGKIDENNWSIHPRSGQSHSAVLAIDLELSAGDKLTLELVSSRWKYPKHNLGRFRLSVSDDPNAYGNAEIQFAAMKIDDPWTRLAVVYHHIGDQQAIDQIVKQHPQAAMGIADSYAMNEDWERAIVAYGNLMTEHATDATLLSKRAAAYIATEQWDLARADWLGAIQQQPDLLENAFNAFSKAEQWSTAAEFGLPILKQKPADSYRWLRVAAVIALSDDKAAYTAFCTWIVQQPAESVELAERAIKVCLLRDIGFDIAALPIDTLTDALDSGNHSDLFAAWGWGARALLAYRNADAEAAVRYISKSNEFKPTEFALAMNLTILALAQHQLQHPDEAQTALEQASQLISGLKANPPKNGYHDLLIAETLLREAETTINAKAKP